MNATLQLPPSIAPYETLADLIEALGDVPLSRIRMKPAPGTATEADIMTLAESADKRLCELIDGVLVEKAMGTYATYLSTILIMELGLWIRTGRWGFLAGEQGAVRLGVGQIRMPDVSFFRRDRWPDGKLPNAALWTIPPDLAVEMLSPGNRPGEMLRKREEYFAAGVRLVWEIDPVTLTVTVYHSLTESIILSQTDTLTGGDILPGFTLPLSTLFAEIVE